MVVWAGVIDARGSGVVARDLSRTEPEYELPQHLPAAIHALGTTQPLFQFERVAMVVKMRASSPFVVTLVDPLIFTIEKAPPHGVLPYMGPTTPKTCVGGEWKDLDAVTIFDWDSAR